MNSFAVVVYALLLMSSFYSNKYILSTLGFQVMLPCYLYVNNFYNILSF